VDLCLSKEFTAGAFGDYQLVFRDGNVSTKVVVERGAQYLTLDSYDF
jgi:hypothetical protein